jgi:hypothetical protein
MKFTTTKPAIGTKGHLLDNFDGTYCFRVYGEDHTFKDYELHHCDLTVTIEDYDAAFYENEDGNMILDHAPATLGKEE